MGYLFFLILKFSLKFDKFDYVGFYLVRKLILKDESVREVRVFLC